MQYHNIISILVMGTLMWLQSTSGNQQQNGGTLQQSTLDNTVYIKLYHAIESPSDSSARDFKYRGQITIPDTGNPHAILKQEPLTPEFYAELKNAARRDGLYFLRAESLTQTTSIVGVTSLPPSTTISETFMKACMLTESNLSDLMHVNLDHNGNFLSIGITTTNPVCEQIRSSSVNPARALFNTTVRVFPPLAAPVPDTQTYIQRLEEEERRRKMPGAQQDNRSFFAKYWMYIVPVVIFVLITGASNPEAQGQR